jgi:hypothetical protein
MCADRSDSEMTDTVKPVRAAVYRQGELLSFVELASTLQDSLSRLLRLLQ